MRNSLIFRGGSAILALAFLVTLGACTDSPLETPVQTPVASLDEELQVEDPEVTPEPESTTATPPPSFKQIEGGLSIEDPNTQIHAWSTPRGDQVRGSWVGIPTQDSVLGVGETLPWFEIPGLGNFAGGAIASPGEWGNNAQWATLVPPQGCQVYFVDGGKIISSKGEQKGALLPEELYGGLIGCN